MVERRCCCPLLLLSLLQASAGWVAGIIERLPIAPDISRLPVGAMAMSDADDDKNLQSALRKAAAEKLGASIESAMKPDDVAWYQAGSNTMVAALLEAKEQLARRKTEVGEEAALAELEATVRGADARAKARSLLKARPVLWLLDRDGVINADVGAPGVISAADLHLIPGSAGAVRRLRLSGKVAIVTNQSARGKGLLGAAELDAIHEALRHQLATTARGGRVGHDQWDALYVCEDAERSRRKKPEPGMILEALQDFDCAPSEAVMIGDSFSDVVAAQRAGCVGVLVATGHGAPFGALLREHGVHLPVTLSIEAADAAATDFLALQRSLASASGSEAARAIEDWIRGRGDDQAALIREALRTDLRVYADLSQAVDELVAMASAL